MSKRREFFWSGRTLRCDYIEEDEGGLITVETEDCLSVDSLRCVVAHYPYNELIVKLLNEHFAKESA